MKRQVIAYPSLSVVIPSRDRRDLLQQATTGLMQQGIHASQITVVDTGTDGSASWAVDQRFNVFERPGATFAEAINAGMTICGAMSPYTLLLNNDVIITTPFWQYMIFVAELHPAAAVGARLLYPSGLIQHAGVGFDTDGSPYHLWHNAPGEHPEAMARRYPPAVTFAAVLINSSFWRDVGRLDESYKNAYEDVDWCLRAREQGLIIAYEPRASLIHLTAQTQGRFDHNAESLAYYRQKWIDTGRFYYATGVWPFNYGG